uniref:GB1/RHD3-type G domain-containing protein n=1 Tax=Chelydra serpentina TaxID=8475 RepID=A0A8C3SHG1_CHESE
QPGTVSLDVSQQESRGLSPSESSGGHGTVSLGGGCPSSDPALSLQQGPGAQPEPGRPVQLVRLDEEGDLILDEEALSHCLEQGGVGAAPICLVSIIGEQRRGKSFLMNYLLRRLRSPVSVDGGRSEWWV